MTLLDFFQKYHASHECKPARCNCVCGCETVLGCTVMTDLCSTCHLSFVRDEDETVTHEPKGPPA